MIDTNFSSSDKDTPQSSTSISVALSRAIHEHKLSPGTKLGEQELGEIYGVSRTVIREALQGLAHAHLVEIKRHRGAFVSSPSPREAREVFDARILVEPRTARIAAEKAVTDDVSRLRTHIKQEHAAMDRGDHGAALRLSGLFHQELATIADHQTLSQFIDSLIARSSLAIALYWKRPSAMCESHAHHALIDAIEAGNGAGAEDLMRAHLEDLLSALDLTERTTDRTTLRDALGG